MNFKLVTIEYVRANNYKLLNTLLCSASYAGMGSVFTLLGSSLLDYQILINEDFQTVATLVQQRAVGYIVGALLAGFIEKYVSKVLFLSLSNLVLGISIIISPWFSNFWPLSVATIFGGISLGFLEIFCNVYTALLWKAQSTNYLQALHLFFDVGALVAPLITRPFLLPIDIDDYNNQQGINSTDSKSYTKDDVLIQYPHLIMGLFLAAVAFVFFIIFIYGNDQIESDEDNDKDKESTNNKPNDGQRSKQILAIVLTALIVNFEFGGQNLVSALGPAFGVKSNLRLNKQDAALLVTIYWSIASIYRLVLIPLTIYFTEATLIIFNVIIVICGASVMAAGADSNLTLTWISFGLLSMGFSPCFAFSFGLIQRYFTISSRVTSLIFFFGTLGESIHPWVVSRYLESSSSFYTIYFATIAYTNSFLCIFLVILMVKFYKKSSPNRDEYLRLD
ncbi:sodium-dependent glucose transporter 1 [Tetranychus urticae]|uniref:Major facilitator superfamily (MFS) profile domain-containing protein n=1 Tax=Tetranychus urticae TaxID=32264 RepID=T1KWJ5_TETUR|nr:sodium-dependent glucose transporter 1 [Tetranychus urticae]